MTYTKPQVVSFPDALSVIQSTPLVKGNPPVTDSNVGAAQKTTIQAYEGDE